MRVSTIIGQQASQEAETARKLADMLSSASDLDAVRETRLKEARVRDAHEKVIEQQSRLKDAKLGKGGFVRDLRMNMNHDSVRRMVHDVGR